MCFAIFELIKFMCFGSTLIYLHEEFLILHPPRNKFNPHLHAKQVPAPAPQMWVPATRAG